MTASPTARLKLLTDRQLKDFLVDGTSFANCRLLTRRQTSRCCCVHVSLNSSGGGLQCTWCFVIYDLAFNTGFGSRGRAAD